MIDFLTRLLGIGRNAPQDRDLDPHEAAAALLVEAALTDGIYANLESDVIAEILIDSFDMTAARADAALRRGEYLAESVTDTFALTRNVKRLPESDRLRVIEALYKVAISDGETCKFEEAYIRHVASLLHIDDVSRALARKRAELTRL